MNNKPHTHTAEDIAWYKQRTIELLASVPDEYASCVFYFVRGIASGSDAQPHAEQGEG